MLAVDPIIKIVDINVINNMGIKELFILSHETMMPIEGGMNIRVIASIRKIETSLTCDTLITLRQSRERSIKSPYMLAGMGKGRRFFINSPTKHIQMIIINCLTYFIDIILTDLSV